MAKVKSVTIVAPDDLTEFHERYAYALAKILMEVAPNNFQKALEIASS